MEQIKYKASCPICGRSLFRGLPNSYMEGNCPKCGSFLQVTFNSTGVNAVMGSTAKDNKKEEDP